MKAKLKAFTYFLYFILKGVSRSITTRLKYFRKRIKAKRSSSPDIQLQLIHYIQKNNHAEIIKIFESGVAIDLPLHRQDLKSTPLAVAAFEGHLDLVKLLLSRKAHVNPKDPELMSPLIMATLGGNSPIVQFLLDQGAYLEAKDMRCGTALELATEMGYTDLVKLFLENGALPTVKALHAACFKGSLEYIDILVKYGADINARNEEGNIPLITASYYGHEDIVKRLLDHGAAINRANNDGETALFFAIGRNHQDVSKLLIEHGIDLTGRSKFGLSPLLLASTMGDHYVVNLINEKLAQ